MTGPPHAARVAVVTGGARGIGAAVARELEADGARVGILDLTGADLSDPPSAAEGGSLRVACDVADEGSVTAAFAEVAATLGDVDVLVNNAGVNASFEAAAMDVDDWDGVLAVDLRGVWLCAKQVLPAMSARGAGAIVNVSSIHARMTQAGTFPYAAAKAGVEGLTRSLALDYGPRGVRVNAVAPGYTRTRLVDEWLAQQPDPQEAARRLHAVNPLGRMAEPAEVAAVVCFLASDRAAAITGATIPVDCGLSVRFAE